MKAFQLTFVSLGVALSQAAQAQLRAPASALHPSSTSPQVAPALGSSPQASTVPDQKGGQGQGPATAQPGKGQKRAQGVVSVEPFLKAPGAREDGLEPAVAAALQLQRQAVVVERGQIMSAKQGAAGGAGGSSVVPSRANGSVTTSRDLGHTAVRPLCSTSQIYTFDGVPTGASKKAIVKPAGPDDPDPAHQIHTITGCLFGDSQAGVQVYLYPFTAQKGGQVHLDVDSWSDGGISVHLDPGISGELDHDVTLVVVRSDGKQAKAPLRFVAARQSRVMRTVPPWAVTLMTTGAVDFASGHAVGSKVAPKFSSPYTGIAKEDALRGVKLTTKDEWAGASAGVDRDAKHLFQRGRDTWSFAKLAPGFTQYGARVAHFNLEHCTWTCYGICPDTFVDQDGAWKAWWQGPETLVVDWEVDSCTTNNGTDASSSYAVMLQVHGPRCVDPWIGTPDKKCMQGAGG